VKLQLWIARALWAGGASLGIGALSGVMSLVMSSLGDRTGAEAVRGVTLVAAAVFALALVALVVLLAVTELKREDSANKQSSQSEDNNSLD